MHRFSLIQLVRGGLIAALYALLALAFPAFSFSMMQFRLSEALVLLPLHWPEAVYGLAIGCFLANLGSPFGIVDIIGGTICTAVAALLTRRFRHSPLIAILAPIVINAIGVGAYLALLTKELFWVTVLWIALSESIAVVVLALPLSRVVARRSGSIKDSMEN